MIVDKDFKPLSLPVRCFEVITWTGPGGRELRCGAHRRKNGTCPNATHHRGRMAAS
jgi:hypothetical protein